MKTKFNVYLDSFYTDGIIYSSNKDILKKYNEVKEFPEHYSEDFLDDPYCSQIVSIFYLKFDQNFNHFLRFVYNDYNFINTKNINI